MYCCTQQHLPHSFASYHVHIISTTTNIYAVYTNCNSQTLTHIQFYSPNGLFLPTHKMLSYCMLMAMFVVFSLAWIIPTSGRVQSSGVAKAISTVAHTLFFWPHPEFISSKSPEEIGDTHNILLGRELFPENFALANKFHFILLCVVLLLTIRFNLNHRFSECCSGCLLLDYCIR